MSEQAADVIRAVYEAFGRGDVEAVLERIADEVDFATEAASRSAPWYGPRHSKSEVAQWFTDLGGATETTVFDVQAVAAQGEEVHTFLRYGFRGRQSGREATMNIHQFFRVRDGKIVYFRGSEDTELVAQTLAG